MCVHIRSDGHAASGPGRAQGRSRVGGNRIKRRPHVGLPQVANHNRIKRRPRAEKVMQAVASRTSSNTRMPATASQRLTTHKTDCTGDDDCS
ncbi:hypothetical protein GW17_00060200 [Ensete ventricosum]|nr:hypothetical protein GW17_00060200 [Ensete ventricosum]